MFFCLFVCLFVAGFFCGGGEGTRGPVARPGRGVSSSFVPLFCYSLALCLTHLYYWWKHWQLSASKDTPRLAWPGKGACYTLPSPPNPAMLEQVRDQDAGTRAGGYPKGRALFYFISGACLQNVWFSGAVSKMPPPPSEFYLRGGEKR